MSLLKKLKFIKRNWNKLGEKTPHVETYFDWRMAEELKKTWGNKEYKIHATKEILSSADSFEKSLRKGDFIIFNKKDGSK